MDQHVSLLNKMVDSGIENVIEEDCGLDYVKMCGVSIRVDGKTMAIWIVIGILEPEADQAGVAIPDYIMTTTQERYYKSMEFLETLSKQVFPSFSMAPCLFPIGPLLSPQLFTLSIIFLHLS